ncbi:putative Ni/Fe-hydrogenase B-type cytochrome subunit [Jannaschia pagri]|uniref:Ni/Fe-hydrogenase B-type cytochrome subunit n=1 Tax=Jannaschia pagri TaxID=2829797 RepID=A0ABQ4NR33_9RHOB|nr:MULTISPECIES: Ni/Fe-hydrogenase, b-type cytochrome subunit [unclassified Jannaschia]GIT93033.1 putative Ni/Fe-hydrogenase B-type cytochrome subunit [Jannaschia sp. AI_61]GIT96868.1 putative Ni/Fe-hydrogenase B-type cytochrome subunit [Jannaschia sp. AI_62]
MKDDPTEVAVPRGAVDVYPTAPLTGDATDADRATLQRRTSVYVYEAPVRLWHWINAGCIMVLIATGYLIGSPLPTVEIAEATHQFIFGYIRFAHFAAAMIMTVGFFGRIYWAFMGNSHARQMFYVPVWRRAYWAELWHEVKWYAFATNTPKKYVGHNPLAQIAMFLFMTVGMTFMIVTGFAMYAEGLGAGSWAERIFGPLIAYVGNTMVLHQLHHLGMWFIIIFMMIHIYAAIREDIMSRQSMVSTMISGHRTFKDDRVE